MSRLQPFGVFEGDVRNDPSCGLDDHRPANSMTTGLRERTKQQTREAIHRGAMRFLEGGLAALRT